MNQGLRGKFSKTSLFACVSLSMVLGSIHSFSVFIPEWEASLDADRADVSLIYSIALVSLTVAVLFGYRIYQRSEPATIFISVGVIASVGLLVSSLSSSVYLLYVSYGLVFGVANGVGYGFTLQLSSQILPKRRGFAMGMVTAFYAVGAVSAPLLFSHLLTKGGNSLALQGAAILILLVALVSASLLKWCGVHFYTDAVAAIEALSPAKKRLRISLWIAYGSGVAAGLMVIGHAYGIAQWQNLDAETAIWATVIIAVGNMWGGFSAGVLADRFSSRTVLMYLPILSIAGLLVLVRSSGADVLTGLLEQYWIIGALALVGYSYGSIIAVFPVAVTELFGPFAAPRIYGQLFTAWGVSGFIGPWYSGWLFDLTGSYTAPIFAAIVLSVVSAIAVRYGGFRSISA